MASINVSNLLANVDTAINDFNKIQTAISSKYSGLSATSAVTTSSLSSYITKYLAYPTGTKSISGDISSYLSGSVYTIPVSSNVGSSATAYEKLSLPKASINSIVINTNTTNITVGALSDNVYPINATVSVSSKVNSAGWIPSGSTTLSAAGQIGTLAKAAYSMTSSGDANISLTPVLSYFNTNSTDTSGNIKVGTVSNTEPTSGYYIHINTSNPSSSYTVSASVTSAGYAPTETIGNTSVSASVSSLNKYIPIQSGSTDLAANQSIAITSVTTSLNGGILTVSNTGVSKNLSIKRTEGYISNSVGTSSATAAKATLSAAIDLTKLSSTLTENNIRAGVTIFGVTGTLKSTDSDSETAIIDAAHLLVGHKAYNESTTLISGTMADYSVAIGSKNDAGGAGSGMLLPISTQTVNNINYSPIISYNNDSGKYIVKSYAGATGYVKSETTYIETPINASTISGTHLTTTSTNNVGPVATQGWINNNYYIKSGSLNSKFLTSTQNSYGNVVSTAGWIAAGSYIKPATIASTYLTTTATNNYKAVEQGWVESTQYVKSGSATSKVSSDIKSLNASNASFSDSGTSGISVTATPEASTSNEVKEGWITNINNISNQAGTGTTKYISALTIASGKTLSSITNNGTITTLAVNKNSDTDNTGIISNLTGSGSVLTIGSSSISNLNINNTSSTININSNTGNITIYHGVVDSGNVYVTPYSSTGNATKIQIISGGALNSSSIGTSYLQTSATSYKAMSTGWVSSDYYVKAGSIIDTYLTTTGNSYKAVSKGWINNDYYVKAGSATSGVSSNIKSLTPSNASLSDTNSSGIAIAATPQASTSNNISAGWITGINNISNQAGSGTTKYLTDIIIPANKYLSSLTLTDATSRISVLSGTGVITSNKATLSISHGTEGAGNVTVYPYNNTTGYKIINNGSLVSAGRNSTYLTTSNTGLPPITSAGWINTDVYIKKGSVKLNNTSTTTVTVSNITTGSSNTSGISFSASGTGGVTSSGFTAGWFNSITTNAAATSGATYYITGLTLGLDKSLSIANSGNLSLSGNGNIYITNADNTTVIPYSSVNNGTLNIKYDSSGNSYTVISKGNLNYSNGFSVASVNGSGTVYRNSKFGTDGTITTSENKSVNVYGSAAANKFIIGNVSASGTATATVSSTTTGSDVDTYLKALYLRMNGSAYTNVSTD